MNESFLRHVSMLGVALFLALAGCQSGPKLAPNQGLQIVRDLQGSSSIEAKVVFSAEISEAVFEVVAGEDKGAVRTFTRDETDKHGAQHVLTLKGVRREFVRADETGAISMTAVIDEENNALSLFDPPLVLMPNTLDRDVPFESRAGMRVVDASNPSKQRENGSAVRTIEYVGDRVVLTPFGEVECHMLTITFTADLRLADDVMKTTLYVSPKYGVVASQWSEQLKVLGAISKERGAVSVLKSEPK